MSKVGILGAGTWGTALARMLFRTGHEVTVWSAIKEEVETIAATRTHKNLPGCEIPEGICFTADIREACAGRDIVVCAVPSVFVRSTMSKAAPYIADGQIIVNVTKGIEPGTLFTMSGVIREVLDEAGVMGNVPIVALSGPTHAEEVARDLPTTIVSACADVKAAEIVQDVFTSPCMRVYTNDDEPGVELCGALKNIIALAAGISAGLGFGDNIKAAIITRGIAEIRRLGLVMGCAEQTFSGLAGIGDLVVTATSRHSRNNRCGMLIGQGMSAEDATREVGMVVEGLNALPAAMALGEKYGVELPIIEMVHAIVSGSVDVNDAMATLMGRRKNSERDRADRGV